MIKRFIPISLLGAGAMLAGCTTPAYVSPVEVTRFTGDETAFLLKALNTISTERPFEWSWKIWVTAW